MVSRASSSEVPQREPGARVDKWLWAVRLYKTRSSATDACRGGHVRVNGAAAKPATVVRPGDRVEVRVHDRDRILEVLRPIEDRVGAAIAVHCLVDHSPPVVEAAFEPLVFVRDAAAGRPTKKERRQLDEFRGR